MTDGEQLDKMNEHLFKWGLVAPWEYRVREIAADAVRQDLTYVGGYVFPVRRDSRNGYIDVRVRLHPTLKSHPEIAQLIAEQEILEQTT